MFRILIVDDERRVLNGIRMMIEKDLGISFPMDIVTASNVPQAIELLDSFRADLLLTDIRMPVMDGFELIRYVKEKGLSMNVVILTSHADFEYAQKAIRFHVKDFILKPIDAQLLKTTIENAYLQKKEKEQVLLCSAMQEVRNMMLYDLAAQELLSDPDLVNRLFPHMYFTVVVLALPRAEEYYTEVLKKILLRYYKSCYCFWMKERSQIVAICNHEQYHIRLVNINREFVEEVQSYEASHRLDESGCYPNAPWEDLFSGVSISANSYKALHSLYINAVQRIFYARSFGDSSVLTELSIFTYQDCVRIFQEKDEVKARQYLREYLVKIQAISDSSAESPYSRETILRSFVCNILLYLENNHIYFTADQLQAESGRNEEKDFVTVILDWMKQVKNMLQKKQEQYENDVQTRRLLSYIRQHYWEDVSLDDLAAHVGMNPNYICMTFKKNIGQSYLTILHKERLLNAKKLMRETDFTMGQIAEEVGYNSTSQLARVFRKYEGKSPSEFRSEMSR